MKFRTIIPIAVLLIIGVASVEANCSNGQCSRARADNFSSSYNNNNNGSRRYENVDTEYNNPYKRFNPSYESSAERYSTKRMPRTGYNGGFNNYNKRGYDADYSSGYEQ